MSEYHMTGLSQLRGAMLRQLDKGDKLIFEFDETQQRVVHSLLVFYRLQVDCFESSQNTTLVESIELAPFAYCTTKPCNKIIETVI